MMDKLKLIKTIVFFITFLLVIGTISLLGIIYKKTSDKHDLASTDINLHQDLGSEISSFRGENGTIYLLIKGASQSDKLIIIREDTATPQEIKLS